MNERARQGLDLLLAEYPEAEVALVINQEHPLDAPWAYVSNRGPWTCVDLIIDGERRQFAIWNHTGDVYGIEGPGGTYPGAVEDDPFLRVA